MSAVTHKIGLELQILDSADYRKELVQKICGKSGVIYAEFSRENPNVVVIEYDPYVIKSSQLCLKVNNLNGKVVRKVFM